MAPGHEGADATWCPMTRDELSPADRTALLALIDKLADLARPETLRHFRTSTLVTDNKDVSGFDPVTQADRATEAALRAALVQHRPEDAIAGEEFADSVGTSGLTWIIDPIDGTRAYLSGTPCWGVLIALADKDGPFLGVIDQPYIGERFLGGLGVARGTGPMGERALQCRSRGSISDAILFSTFPEIGSAQERAAFERVAAQVRLTRYGMDCYSYALLALGQIDLVIEAGLKPYDFAAPLAVIEAAGGIVTDWQGNPPGATGQVIAAGCARVHAQALALLNG